MIDSSGLEKELDLIKKYRIYSAYYWNYQEALEEGSTESEDGLPIKKFFTVTDVHDENEYFDIEGKHCLSEGIQDGAFEVERSIGISLPDDFHEFYRNWGGGWLMTGQYHYILTPEEMVGYVSYLKSLGVNCNPREILRFCSVGNGDFMSLQNKDGRWRIIYHVVDFDDEMMMAEREENIDNYGETMQDWICGVLKRDGDFLGDPPGVNNDPDLLFERIA